MQLAGKIAIYPILNFFSCQRFLPIFDNVGGFFQTTLWITMNPASFHATPKNFHTQTPKAPQGVIYDAKKNSLWRNHSQWVTFFSSSDRRWRNCLGLSLLGGLTSYFCRDFKSNSLENGYEMKMFLTQKIFAHIRYCWCILQTIWSPLHACYTSKLLFPDPPKTLNIFIPAGAHLHRGVIYGEVVFYSSVSEF